MATDIEESDTEDHDRPAPPKRQCIKIINDGQTVKSVESDEPSEADSESLAREKVIRYQQWQVDKHCYMGSVDNTINRVLETYILTPPLERSQFRLLREAEMEDTAVMMAIHNHGLVHSTDTTAHDRRSSNDGFCLTNNSTQIMSQMSSESSDSNSACATSSKIFTSRTFQQFNNKGVTYKHDKPVDDGDQQQDILERAVAEAIKIKGLSALSVDYG